MSTSGRTLLLCDLAARVIAGSASPDPAPGAWRAVPYEAEGAAGTLLGCGKLTEPGPVTIRLGAQGPHRISLGIPVFHESNRIRVRLTGDLCCSSFATPDADYHRPAIHEMVWKEADLTGQDLVLDGFWGPEPAEGALAYVKLEPVDGLPEMRAPRVASPLAITEDGHGVFYWRPHRRQEDLLERYESIGNDTALRILLWCACHGDCCTYPTNTGRYGLSAGPDPFRYGDRQVERNIELWRRNGWDAMRIARDYCRGRGWEFHLSIRVQAFRLNYPHDQGYSPLFDGRPEWRCRDREGRVVARMSYAEAGVQERMLALVEELAAYEPDGVNLILIRGLPMMLYEPAAVNGFKDKHGADPRELDEDDPRWLDHQAATITAFMRRVKERLRPGMRLSAILPGCPADLRRWGLDVRTWTGEGIVDDLYPVGQRFTDHDVHIDAPDALDFGHFQSLPGRQGIRLFPTLYPWRGFREDPEGWQRRIESFLRGGADGYCVWDGAYHDMRRYARIGLARDPDAAPDRQSAEKGATATVRRIVMLGGLRVDRYHPIEAH